MKNLISLFLTVFLVSIGAAQETGWRDEDGNPVPDASNVKGSEGFGGWLLVTPDKDWEEKWLTPRETAPRYSEASTVRVGEQLFTLIMFANPKTDSTGIAEVRCNLRVIRPDGSFSVDLSDQQCFKGPLAGHPHDVRLTDLVLGFTGEPDDLRGVWVTEVTLVDVVRSVRLDLRTSFELVDDEA